MKLRKLASLLAAGILILIFNSAKAVSISLEAPASALIGDLFDVNIWVDSSDDPTLGGVIDLLFDSSLVSFVDFSYATVPGPPIIIPYTPPIETEPGRLAGIVVGESSGLVGTAVFTADATGAAVFGVEVAGSFFSAANFSEQFVETNVVTVRIVPVSEIPVPAAVWLLGSGFLGLIRIARRKNRLTM